MNDLTEMTERMATLRTKLDEERGTLAGLEASVAQAYQGGEDPEGLIREQTESASKVRAMESAISGLEERIREAQAADFLTRVEERLSSIKRETGGLAGEHPRRLGRLSELVDKVVEEVRKIESDYQRSEALRSEAGALVSRFRLGMPDLLSVEPPGQSESLRASLARLRSDLRFTDRRSGFRKAGGAPSDSPGAALLREAGPSVDEIAAQDAEERKRTAREAADRKALAPIEGELARAQVGTRF